MGFTSLDDLKILYGFDPDMDLEEAVFKHTVKCPHNSWLEALDCLKENNGSVWP